MKVVRIQNLGSIMIIGVFVSLCAWVFEAAVHSFILREGRLSVQMFYPALSEVWHRLAMAVCFVGLGAYAQSQFAARRRAEVDFRQLEITFGTVFEKVNDGLLIADAATRKFVEVNRTMCDMLGYTREEVLGLGVEAIHPPQDLPDVFAAFERYVRSNEKISIGLPVMRKDGTVFYADIGHTTISLNGKPCAVAIFRDITERKQAEAETEGLFRELAHKAIALKESEARFRSIAETAIDVIYRLDPKSIITYASPAVLHVLGYRIDETVGKHFLEFVHPDDHPVALAAYQALLGGADVRALDLRVMKSNNGFIHGELNIVPLMQNNVVCEIQGVIRDITERKQAEEVLAQSRQQLEEMVSDRTQELQKTIIQLNYEIDERKKNEAALRDSWNKFRQLAENINEVFWIRDTHTRKILYISPAYEAIWGKTCESLYERPESLFDSVQPEDAERVAAAVQKQKDGIFFDEKYRIIRQDGSVRWIWARTFPVYDAAGETIRYVGIAEDITEQRLSGEKLRDYAGRLQSLSRSLVEAQESERRSIARELHDEIGQLATGLKVGLDVLNRTISGNEAAQVKHLQTTAAELLGRARNLSLSLRPSMLDDLGLLPALVWHFDRYTALTGIKVRFTQNGMDRRLPPEVETAFYRVTQEALTNVARHADIQSVGVEISASGRAVCLTIEDEGSGFCAESVLSGHESIGLFGMRERAESVGGALFIRSSPGRGTTIAFNVPLRSNEEVGE